MKPEGFHPSPNWSIFDIRLAQFMTTLSIAASPAPSLLFSPSLPSSLPPSSPLSLSLSLSLPPSPALGIFPPVIRVKSITPLPVANQTHADTDRNTHTKSEHQIIKMNNQWQIDNKPQRGLCRFAIDHMINWVSFPFHVCFFNTF